MSQFHPLTHLPGTRNCRSFHGGTRHHLSLAWEYLYKDTVLWLPRRLFRCPFGKHQLLLSRSEAHCGICRFERPLTDAEDEHMQGVQRSLDRLQQALREKRRNREVVD